MQVFPRVISELKFYYFTQVRLLMGALHNTAYLMVTQYEAMLEASRYLEPIKLHGVIPAEFLWFVCVQPFF